MCKNFIKKIKNWLPINERVSQYSLCSVYESLIKNCSSYQKLNVLNRKITVGQKALIKLLPQFRTI